MVVACNLHHSGMNAYHLPNIFLRSHQCSGNYSTPISIDVALLLDITMVDASGLVGRRQIEHCFY